ncbi:MAG TPA: deoxyribodipyrimidine photo-lyase [Prolixibacteraceae bacterium]|nr:deoxyribodipyrimidine photo-lyase [Prolixibacteraceae bacterium]
MKKFNLSLHIFRRDLRLDDNSALLAALEMSEQVMPVFIFDERQLENPFHGSNSFQFMMNSLLELNQRLIEKGSRLYFFKGVAHEVLEQILEKTKAQAVFVNRDYTPFSRQRDEQIASVCQKHQVEFNTYADALINEPEQVLKNDGNPYSVFTPFMRKARFNPVTKPIPNSFSNYFKGHVNNSSEIDDPQKLLKSENPNILLNGGREEGLALHEKLHGLFNYDVDRNLPAVNGISLLSAHHKFGTVSVRESYWRIVDELGPEHTLINQLYWRDFFSHVVWNFPHVLGKAFKSKYENLAWENDQVKFEKWCKGQTGFPIVDAGMRELTTSGFMHNRVRMIVASFLTKDLHIDWRWGERFFANHLIDYDPAVNNGNWQWAASTGCDAQPYFRIFNPWSQQQKFDYQCFYIKKWVPELSELSASDIHKLQQLPNLLAPNYPRPMVDHSERSQTIKKIFKDLV